MIKLISSKVEDISKTATFAEKNFITVIYQEFWHYLKIVRTLTLWNLWTRASGFNCAWNCGGKICLITGICLITEKKILAKAFFQKKFLVLQYLILVTSAVHLALYLGFWARTCSTAIFIEISSFISVGITRSCILNKLKWR